MGDLFSRVQLLIEAELSKVKLYPYDPSIYSQEELDASRNYLKSLAEEGELLATSSYDVDQLTDRKVLMLVNRQFDGGLSNFMQSDIIEKYKGIISEKPKFDDDEEPQEEFSAVGGIAGFTAPLGAGTSKKKRKKQNKVSARSFGGGKRKKVGKGKYMSKTGTVFPHFKKNIYDS